MCSLRMRKKSETESRPPRHTLLSSTARRETVRPATGVTFSHSHAPYRKHIQPFDQKRSVDQIVQERKPGGAHEPRSLRKTPRTAACVLLTYLWPGAGADLVLELPKRVHASHDRRAARRAAKEFGVWPLRRRPRAQLLWPTQLPQLRRLPQLL